MDSDQQRPLNKVAKGAIPMTRLGSLFCYIKMFEVMAMDSSSTYLFRGLGKSQMKKILAVGKRNLP